MSDSSAPNHRVVAGRNSIPGKYFAVGFGIITFALLLLMLGVAFRFQAIMSHMDKIREAWPPAVLELNDRHTKAEEVLRTSQPELLEEFQQVREKGRFSSLFEDQSPFLFQIEEIISRSNLDQDSLPKLESLPAVQKVQALELERVKLQSDWIGSCAMYFLRLNLPPYFLLK